MDASRSQVVDGVEIVKPRIITGDWDSVTRKFPVAVEFTIAKGWHMYWLNPGDAGSPPEVKWTLPKDWSIGKLQFPVPRFIDLTEGSNDWSVGGAEYVYYDKVVLHTQIISPLCPKANDVIGAEIKWVVCKDVCVAGKDTRNWAISTTRLPYEWPKLPLVPSLKDAGMHLSVVEDKRDSSGNGVISFNLRGRDNMIVTIEDFYPYISSDIPFYWNITDNVLIFGGNRSTTTPLKAVNGLIFTEGKAYWIKQP